MRNSENRLLGSGETASLYVKEDGGKTVVEKKSVFSLKNEGKILFELQCFRHYGKVAPDFYKYTPGDLEETITMEYVEGISLKQFLEGAPRSEELVKILAGLAENVNILHSLPRPVVFLDLKPENILIVNNTEPLLCDFGCAQYAGETMVLCGSPGFSDPAQFEKGIRVLREMDIYALGRIMEYALEHTCPGKRVKQQITSLIRQCLDSDVVMRPTAAQIRFELMNIGRKKLPGIRCISNISLRTRLN